jgi:hypothetical protein
MIVLAQSLRSLERDRPVAERSSFRTASDNADVQHGMAGSVSDRF